MSEEFQVFVEPTKKQNQVKYIFKEKNNVITEHEGSLPVELSPMSLVGKTIKKYLDPNNQFRKDIINKNFDKVKQILQENYETSKLLAEQLESMKKSEEENYLKEQLSTGEKILKGLNQPLIWIASNVEWLTAGERNNIILTFIAYASQVLLKNPISVIGLGEGGSGKTHIQEVALSLIPKHLIVDEKKISDAAMFNRAKEDPYFYDGKIVNYGDLGGVKDQDFIMEAKNLLKELQSEGKLNKPLSVVDADGEWITRDLKLLGKPCLTYTTVPGHQFDDQEKSRSIFITPRMNNKKVFNQRKSMLEMRGITYKQMQKFKMETDIIPFIIMHLRDVLEEVNIVNPYVSIVIDFLSESDYFKRDFDKYNGILKTITALNYYNKELHEVNGEKIIYTSLEDVQLFFSLLKPYHESIQFNISPKAADVLNELRENMNDWEKYYLSDENMEDTTLEPGLTTTDYFEKHNLMLSKRSVQKYFKELNEAGFIKVVRNKGRTSIYNLTGNIDEDTIDGLFKLSKEAKESITYELGEDVKDIICDDEISEGLDMLVQHEDIPIPPWNRYDFKEYRLKISE